MDYSKKTAEQNDICELRRTVQRLSDVADTFDVPAAEFSEGCVTEERVARFKPILDEVQKTFSNLASRIFRRKAKEAKLRELEELDAAKQKAAAAQVGQFLQEAAERNEALLAVERELLRVQTSASEQRQVDAHMYSDAQTDLCCLQLELKGQKKENARLQKQVVAARKKAEEACRAAAATSEALTVAQRALVEANTAAATERASLELKYAEALEDLRYLKEHGPPKIEGNSAEKGTQTTTIERTYQRRYSAQSSARNSARHSARNLSSGQVAVENVRSPDLAITNPEFAPRTSLEWNALWQELDSSYDSDIDFYTTPARRLNAEELNSLFNSLLPGSQSVARRSRRSRRSNSAQSRVSHSSVDG